MSHSPHHEFARGEWNPTHPSKRGAETAKAKRAGRSLHAQAEKDSHSSDPTVRGRGVFALNAQRGKFKHAGKRSTRRSRSRA
jgi:hypothetical protein